MSVMASEASAGEGRGSEGARKAATILLAMGKLVATRLLRHFDALELRGVARSAAHLGSVPMATLDALVAEFSSDFASGANLLGDVGRAQDMLSDVAPPDQVSAIMADAVGVAQVNVWDALASVPDATFAAYLKDEHPATATCILARLDSPVAGRLIALLPPDMRDDLFSRMIAPAAVSDSAMRLLEDALRDDLLSPGKRGPAPDNRARMAQIINALDPADAEAVMQRLAQTRPRDAQVLQSLLFSFTDLPRLSLRARALLFDKVSTDIVVLALRGTEADFRDVVLSSMASRARRLVEGELNNASSASVRDIAKARKQIADVVLAMAQRNEIEIAPPAETPGA